MRVLFLGVGAPEVAGLPSGLVYHVSERRRRFTAHADDAPAILRRRDFILAP